MITISLILFVYDAIPLNQSFYSAATCQQYSVYGCQMIPPVHLTEKNTPGIWMRLCGKLLRILSCIALSTRWDSLAARAFLQGWKRGKILTSVSHYFASFLKAAIWNQIHLSFPGTSLLHTCFSICPSKWTNVICQMYHYLNMSQESWERHLHMTLIWYICAELASHLNIY